MLEFTNRYARNFFSSQNGEEGILLEVVSRLGIKQGHSVEIGGANGLYCSNTALLLKDHGWSGLFVESNFNLYQQCVENWKDNPKVKVQCSHVGENNVNAFVDDSCDVFSTDTDGADFRIFKGLKAKPKIAIVEIDSSIDPDSHEFNSDGAGGFTITLMLALNRGYFLLCHTGNMIFVDVKYRELFPEIIGDGLSNAGLYFKRDWMKAA